MTAQSDIWPHYFAITNVKAAQVVPSYPSVTQERIWRAYVFMYNFYQVDFITPGELALLILNVKVRLQGFLSRYICFSQNNATNAKSTQNSSLRRRNCTSGNRKVHEPCVIRNVSTLRQRKRVVGKRLKDKYSYEYRDIIATWQNECCYSFNRILAIWRQQLDLPEGNCGGNDFKTGRSREESSDEKTHIKTKSNNKN